MIAETSYQATFDALAIIRRLEDTLQGVTVGEVHLLAYLACLLGLYRGRPASDWAYQFVRSSWGAPYSPAIEASLNEGRSGGLIAGDEVCRLTEEGRTFVDFLCSRAQHTWRKEYIDGASASALSIPSGVIRDALREEPSLRLTALHAGAQPLLDRWGLALLHEHFRALSEAVGPEIDDLMVPSVVWIRYLAEVRQHHDEALFANEEAEPNEASVSTEVIE